MVGPNYSIGDVKYVKESAALGFLEAVKISGVAYTNSMWVYSIAAGPSQPLAPSLYGDRTSLVNGNVLYFTEDELIDQCAALNLAEIRAQQVLAEIQAKKNKSCR
jgi:hypothetical protein